MRDRKFHLKNTGHMLPRIAAIPLVLLLIACGGSRSNLELAPVSPMESAPRAELERRAGELEQQITSGVLSGSRRTEAENELSRLRKRLSEGDVRVGDQLVISLLGDTITADTATVRDQFLVNFAGLPDVAIAGALKSELRERLQTHTDKYYRNATVRSQLLTRVAIVGEVMQPGFYVVSPDRPVTELMMLAGGPTPLTNLSRVTVRRGGREIISEKDWQRARDAGMTVAQLALESGDQIEVGRSRQVNWGQVAQITLVAVASVTAVMQILVLIYRNDG